MNLNVTSGGRGVGVGGGGGSGPMKPASPASGGRGVGVGGGGLVGSRGSSKRSRSVSGSLFDAGPRSLTESSGTSSGETSFADGRRLPLTKLFESPALPGPPRRRKARPTPPRGRGGPGGRGRRIAAGPPAHEREQQHDSEHAEQERLALRSSGELQPAPPGGHGRSRLGRGPSAAPSPRSAK